MRSEQVNSDHDRDHGIREPLGNTLRITEFRGLAVRKRAEVMFERANVTADKRYERVGSLLSVLCTLPGASAAECVGSRWSPMTDPVGTVAGWVAEGFGVHRAVGVRAQRQWCGGRDGVGFGEEPGVWVVVAVTELVEAAGGGVAGFVDVAAVGGDGEVGSWSGCSVGVVLL